MEKVEKTKEKKQVASANKKVEIARASKKISKKMEESRNEKKCKDKNCHIHGNLKVRGRSFEGEVTKKFYKRIVIELERMTYVRKYERYAKSRTKIHARLPICMEEDIQVGDRIKIQECRPLSKMVHHVVIKKIKDRSEK